MSDRILVLGAAGRLGRVASEAFRDGGWTVVSLVRPGAKDRAAPGTIIVEADANDLGAVVAAAHGAAVVLHALNPPYTDWPRRALPLAEIAIAAAESAGATLLFPGNVYNYGAELPEVIDETAPMHPTSRKGKLRVAIEERTREASVRGMRTIIVRAGDFYGGIGRGSWFDLVIAKDIGRGRVTYPGPLAVVHAWAYLPDLASVMVRLANAREGLGPFETFGFPGHSITGAELIDAIAKAMHRPVQVRPFPWWLIRLFGPLAPTWREIGEMRYLWRLPHRLCGDKLRAVIGDVPDTPLPLAVATTLAALGFKA